MTHKRFYVRATEEVAAGKVDGALWIKICADHAGLSDGERQAKYVQARAHELEEQDGREWISRATRAGTIRVDTLRRAVCRHRRALARGAVLAAAVVLGGPLILKIREAVVTRDHILDVSMELGHLPVAGNTGIRVAAERDMSESCYRYQDIWATSLNKVPGALDERTLFLCQAWFGHVDRPWNAEHELAAAARMAGDQVEESR